MSFRTDGFELLDGYISSENISSIKDEISMIDSSSYRGGIRNAEKKLRSVSELISETWLFDLASKFVDSKPEMVRAILFIKNQNSNWQVSWHQDKTIAVSSQFESEQMKCWSIKDNTHHAQPDVEVLDKMVTFRIHLDNTSESNGCLKVIPGSHLNGIMNQSDIQDVISCSEPYSCNAKEGDILVMRPHLLHSSSKIENGLQRRILHVEFSTYELPEGVSYA